jgi:hypothetical protein
MRIKMRDGATAKKEGQAEEGLDEGQAGSECGRYLWDWKR